MLCGVVLGFTWGYLRKWLLGMNFGIVRKGYIGTTIGIPFLRFAQLSQNLEGFG